MTVFDVRPTFLRMHAPFSSSFVILFLCSGVWAGCTQPSSGGLSKMYLVGSDQKLHGYEFRHGVMQQVETIPLETSKDTPPPMSLEPGLVGHGIDLGAFPITANCGDSVPFYRYRNTTGRLLELVLVVRNDGRHCPIRLVGRLVADDGQMEPEEHLIGLGDPGGRGGGSVDIPPRREMVFFFRCWTQEPEEHVCKGLVDVFRY